MVYVDEETCTGCGLCLDACPQDAIELVQEVAVIQADRCNQCLACVEVCPNGAILSVEEPSRALEPVAQPVTPEIQTRSSRATEVLRDRVLPAAGTALAFIGRKVVPYVADVMLDALERRSDLARQPESGRTGVEKRPSRAASRRTGGGRRQRRRRRGSGRG